MGIGKLQGKLDEMVQWGRGRGRGEGGGRVTDFNFFFTKNGLEYSPPPQQQQQQQQMCSTQ